MSNKVLYYRLFFKPSLLVVSLIGQVPKSSFVIYRFSLVAARVQTTP
jgi:hypothetical protein